VTDPEILTLQQLAKRLSCSEPHVRKLAKTQGLPHIRLGKLWRFRLVDVKQWEEEQAKNGAA